MKKRLFWLIIPMILLIIGVGAYVVVNATPGSSIKVSDYFEYTVEGFNSTAYLNLTRKDDMMFDEIDVIRIEQKEALIKNNNVTADEYMIFAAGIEAIPDKTENLSNGDTITFSFLYNKELAKELRIAVDDTPVSFTVSGLKDALVLTKEDLFADLNVTFSGISPNVTMEITNNSANEFIQGLVFNPVEYKETYQSGDEVAIRCFYDDSQTLSDTYLIEGKSEDCIMTYKVDNVDTYATDLSQIPDSVIREAIDAGKSAFVDANEYGVRIFCEAHLVPVYIDKKATFRYLTPRLISAYFKTVNASAAGKDGNHYNDLDLIYEVEITQADGVTCGCEAVVRFSEFLVKGDGSLEYDFSNPKIISASYQNSAIVKNVVTKYEDTYSIEKLDISKY